MGFSELIVLGVEKDKQIFKRLKDSDGALVEMYVEDIPQTFDRLRTVNVFEINFATITPCQVSGAEAQVNSIKHNMNF